MVTPPMSSAPPMSFCRSAQLLEGGTGAGVSSPFWSVSLMNAAFREAPAWEEPRTLMVAAHPRSKDVADQRFQDQLRDAGKQRLGRQLVDSFDNRSPDLVGHIVRVCTRRASACSDQPNPERPVSDRAQICASSAADDAMR